MDHQSHAAESRKNKHLNFEERMIIELRLKDGFSPYKIAKELGRSINTVLNEIRRGLLHRLNRANLFKCILQIRVLILTIKTVKTLVAHLSVLK